MFRERDSFVSDKAVLVIEFIAVDRRSDAYTLNVQFVGFDNENIPIFAMSVEPMFDLVSSGIEEIQGDTYLYRSVLPHTVGICAMFVIGD